MGHNLYFWRDHHGHEVDFIKANGSALVPIEVKSSETLSSALFDGLNYWQKLASVERGYLAYGGTERQVRSHQTVVPWCDAGEI